jgi:hypothetical protein
MSFKAFTEVAKRAIVGVVIAPLGASYQNGSVVEVHCTLRPNCTPGGIFQASRIVVESAEDSAFQPGSGQRFEAEGLVSGFTVHPGDFSVAGTPVTTTVSTRFEGGIASDLGNDIKVEAEGTWNGTRLVASKIEFKRSVIRLQGVVTASTAPSFTLTVTGAGAVTVETDSLTSGDISGGAVPPVAPGCIQVRGQRKAGGGVVVTASEIRTSCSNGDSISSKRRSRPSSLKSASPCSGSRSTSATRLTVPRLWMSTASRSREAPSSMRSRRRRPTKRESPSPERW